MLRGQIEARIAAAGVERFSVRTVEADAQVDDGRVVGTCARGSRKIVYRTQAAATPASRPMLTECRDGSTPAGGVPTGVFGSLARGFDVWAFTALPLMFGTGGMMLSSVISIGVISYLVSDSAA